MKLLRTAIILAAMAAASLLPLVLAQGKGPAQQQDSASAAQTAQNPVRIVSPATGQVVNQNFVVLKFELSNPGVAGGSPNFRIQLDSRDPVVTTFNEYTFTGLTAGEHTVIVELVDANNTPIPGTRAELRFNVAQPRPALAPGRSVASNEGPQQALTGSDETNLPEAGSALPLLSVIGFGALLGGVASALRTR